MADAVDLKSSVFTDVWVRIPPALLIKSLKVFLENLGLGEKTERA